MLEVLLIHNDRGIQVDYVRQLESQPRIEHVRWINTVISDPYEDPMRDGSHSYIDPVLCGAWDVQPGTDCSKYYWDNADHEGTPSRYKVNHYKNNPADNKFRFTDLPNDSRLKAGKPIQFRTCLVDVTNNDKELACVSWNLAGKNSNSKQVILKDSEPKTMSVTLPNNLIQLVNYEH